MSAKVALYRKYRPFNFSAVYGQEIIIKTLQSAIKNHSINHAYIFSGPRGSGKTSIAKIFARAINCEQLDDKFDICTTCKSCTTCINDQCLDIIELDAASNNGINEIRNIINSISFIPNELKYKVYIIDEAHMLTTNSWNALLKTLEEPPPYVVFIFATTEYNKIPPTIISRCQRFDFNRLTDQQLNTLLLDICSKENIKIDHEAINTIVQLADGAARDAISILDQLTSFANEIKIDDVNQVFGLVNNDYKVQLLNLLFNKNLQEIILMLNDWYQKGINFALLLSDLIKILFDKILYCETNSSLHIKFLNESHLQKLNNVPTETLLKILNHFNSHLNKLSKSNDQLFEIQLIFMQAINLLEQNEKPTLPNESKKMPSDDKLKITNKHQPKTDSFALQENSDNVSLQPTSSIFKTKVRSINHPQNVSKTNVASCEFSSSISNENNNNPNNENTPLQLPPIDYKDFFYRVASNNDNVIKDNLNKIFVELQLARAFETPLINKFLVGKKFLICSNNGCVMLFDNASQAQSFNHILNNNEFKDWFDNHFKMSNVIGIDKNLAKEWTDDFKKEISAPLDDVKNNNDDKQKTKSLILDILSN